MATMTFYARKNWNVTNNTATFSIKSGSAVSKMRDGDLSTYAQLSWSNSSKALYIMAYDFDFSALPAGCNIKTVQWHAKMHRNTKWDMFAYTECRKYTSGSYTTVQSGTVEFFTQGSSTTTNEKSGSAGTWTYSDLTTANDSKIDAGFTGLGIVFRFKHDVSGSNYCNLYEMWVTVEYATTYTITTSAGTGGTISPSSPSVESGSSQTFTITPSTGYNVSDVKVDGTSVGAVTSYTFNNVTAAHTISATFAKKTYKITTTAGTGGSISPSNPNVEHGTNKAFTITANTGYQISDVKVDGTSVGAVSSYTFSNVTATHTIAATFALKTYTITATAGSHGSISPASASVTHGGSQTFTITPATGYNIEDVKVDGTSVGAVSSYTFSNVTATHTISATFVSAQTRPYITGVSMTYNQTQISANNKVPAGQGYIIRVEVIEQ